MAARLDMALLLGLALTLGCATATVGAKKESNLFAGEKKEAQEGAGNGEAKSWSTASGLKIEEKKIGTGAEAKKGSTVMVFYRAKTLEGKLIHSSRKLGSSFSFEIGKEQVIKGWEEGLVGMKVGGQRRLTVPPYLGYGSYAVSNADRSIEISKNSTVIYDIKLIDIQ